MGKQNTVTEQPKSTSKEYHEYLVSKGETTTSYDEFMKMMSDKQQATGLYDYLKSSKLVKAPTFDEFESEINKDNTYLQTGGLKKNEAVAGTPVAGAGGEPVQGTPNVVDVVGREKEEAARLAAEQPVTDVWKPEKGIYGFDLMKAREEIGLDKPVTETVTLPDGTKVKQERKEIVPFEIKAEKELPPVERSILGQMKQSVVNSVAYDLPADIAAGFAATKEFIDPRKVFLAPGSLSPNNYNDFGREFQQQSGKSIDETKLELINWANSRKDLADRSGIIGSLSQIRTDSYSDFASDASAFVLNSIVQSVPQMGAGYATGGGSLYAQSIGATYLDAINARAASTGKPVSAIMDDIDEMTVIGTGVGMGMLEKMGMDEVLGIGKKELVGRAIGERLARTMAAAASEGTTEGAQAILQEVGSKIGMGQEASEALKSLATREFAAKLADNVAAGFAAGGGMSGAANTFGALASSRESEKQQAPIEQPVQETAIPQEAQPVTTTEPTATIEQPTTQTQYNQENIQGVPSEIGGGQEPVQAKPIQEPSGKAPETSGVLQTQEGQQEVLSKLPPEKIPSVENNVEYVTATGNQKVSLVDGELTVTDMKTGKPSSDKTRRKALNEYADDYDFTRGEMAPDPDFAPSSETELNSYIVENTKNPYQLAEIFANEEPQPSRLSSKERMIAEFGIGKITTDSYSRFGDKNNLSQTKARAYLNNTTGRSLDVVAQEMSEEYGTEITPQDIVDFMDRFPTGERDAMRQGQSDVAIAASEKFSQLTGLRLDEKMAEKVIDKSFRALKADEQLLLEREYETAKQLEDDYWKTFQETDGFTKESPVGETVQTGTATEATGTTQTGAAQTIEQRQQVARERFNSAASRLSDKLASRIGAKTNLMQEEEGAILDDLREMVDAAFELGATSVESAVNTVKTYINADSRFDNVRSDLVSLIDRNMASFQEKTPKFGVSESELETGKTKRGDYIRRRMADMEDQPWFREEVNNSGDYKRQSLHEADKASARVLADLEKELGAKGAIRELIRGVRDRETPPIMFGSLTARAMRMAQANDLREEASILFKLVDERSRSSAREMASLRSDASPAQTVSRRMAGIDAERFEKSEEIREDVSALKKELDEIREKYDKLQKERAASTEKQERKPTEKQERAKRVKEKRQEGLSLIGEGLEELVSKLGGLKKASEGNPITASDKILKGIVSLMDSYLIETGGNIEDAFKKLKGSISKLTNKAITGKHVQDARQEILDGANIPVAELEKLRAEENRKALEKFLTKTEKKAVKPKPKKTDFEKMVEAISKGALREDDLVDMFASYFGFQSIPTDVRTKLMGYVEELDKYAENSQDELYNRKAVEMMDYMVDRGLGDETLADIMLSAWYTSVLSSPSTLSRAIKGQAITGSLDIITSAIATPGAFPGALRSLVSGLKAAGMNTYMDIVRNGFSSTEYIEHKPQGSGYVERKVKSTFAQLRANNDTSGAVVKFFMTAPVLVYRNLIALDAVMKYGMQEYHAYISAYNKIIGLDNRSANFLDEMNKALGRANTREIKDTVAREVVEMRANNEKVPLGYEKRRELEIMREKRDETVNKRSIEAARSSVLMQSPTGQLSIVFKHLSNMTSKKTKDGKSLTTMSYILRGIFPFLRVPVNFVNEALNYTPIGIKRAITKTKLVEGVDWVEKSPEERRQALAKSAIGAVVGAAVFMMMFDWDEEKEEYVLKEDAPIKLTGKGMDNFADNLQIEKGYKQWSYRVRLPDGSYSDAYSYVDNPLGIILAGYGVIADEILIKDFKKKVGDKEYAQDQKTAGYIVSQIAFSASDFATAQSFSQGFNKLSQVIMNKKSVEDRAKPALELVVNPVSGAFPNLYKEIYKQTKAVVDIPEKDLNQIYTKPFKYVPGAENILGNDRYDVFGYPIVREFNVPLVPDVVLQMAKTNLDYKEDKKAWQVVWKHPGVMIGSFGKIKEVGGKRATKEQQEEYQRVAGERLREQMENSYETLIKMEPVKLQERLSKMKSQAGSYAKSRLKAK